MQTATSNSNKLSRAVGSALLTPALGVSYDYFPSPLETHALNRVKWQLEAIAKVTKAVAASDDPAYYEERIGIRLSKVVLKLWQVIDRMDDLYNVTLEGLCLDPHLRVMVPLFRKWSGKLRWWRTPHGGLSLDHEYIRRLVAHIVYVIRRVLRSDRFKAAVVKHQRGAKDRYESCAKYLLAIFKDRAKVLFLRVDFYLEGEGKFLGQSPAARFAFDKLASDFQDGLVIPGVIGFIDCVEGDITRGIHHHYCAIVDGDRHQDGYRLSEAIGNYWVEKCVGSPHLASFQNCWLRRAEYRYNALGVVHYTDSESLMGVREMLEYMTKAELASLSFVNTGIKRKLRKGQAPETTGDPQRGAPRKHDLSVAKQVLQSEANPVPDELRLPGKPKKWNRIGLAMRPMRQTSGGCGGSLDVESPSHTRCAN